MRKRYTAVLTTLTIVIPTYAGAASPAPALLEGDERTACEVILCLSTGQRPSECTPPLKRFFSIRHRKPHKQLRKRMDFLSMCPDGGAVDDTYRKVLATSGQTCQMDSLLSYLNGYKGDPDFAPTMPAHCEAYAKHPLTYAVVLPVQQELCAEVYHYEYGYNVKHCIVRWVDPTLAGTPAAEAAALREIEDDLAKSY